ncbi:MAG: Ig-like domain repeat protein [Acidobacteriia bacterium]|nr:Ig-like domain repeat protein [Terriglobia bacterium]
MGNPPSGTTLQLIVSRVYQTPVSVNCQLALQQQDITLANINNPVFEDPINLNDPNIPDPQVNNATFALRPGETALVTLRGTIDTNTMQTVVANVAPVLIPHPANPNSTNPQFAAPLFITLNFLPDATFGQAYSTTLQAIGGTTPYTWNISSGALPAGLTLNSSTGTISGTPTTPGTSSFSVQVTDSSSPQRTTLKSLSLTVDKMATTTSVVSSSNPSVFGQSVTFTATASPVVAGAGTPGGTVTFMDGANALGTVAVGAGSATLTTSSLTVGTHSITAVYGGDPNFLGGTSGVLSQTVKQASTSTLLVSTLNSTLLGQSVTFTATVSAVAPGSGVPSGTVTFKDGTTILGSAAVNGGIASFTIGSLTAGNHPVTAIYSGDANFLGSSSAILTQVVNRGNTTTVVASTPNPSGVNQAVTFTATVSVIAPSTGTPTGSVTFNDGSTALGTTALSSGTATFTTSTLTAGTHSITAVYSGDINFSGSTSAALTQTFSYTFVGFLGPLTAAGTFSSPSFSGSANLGSAVPLKWQLKDSNGNFISSVSTLSLLQASLNTNCAGPPEGPAVVLYSPTNGATGGSTFRYDTSNNQFIFNWDTTSVVPIGPGCYSVLLQLNNNSPIRATIVQLN